MPASVVFETAIGLAFVFLTVSLVSSGIVEAVANRLNARGDYLLRGLREMLDMAPVVPGETTPDPAKLEVPGRDAAAGEVPSLTTVDLDGGLSRKNLRNRRPALEALATAGTSLRGLLSDNATEMEDAAKENPNATPGPVSRVTPAFALADMVLAHPLVAALHRPSRPGRKRQGTMNLSSYLSARTFATSLVDILVPNGGGKTTIDEIQRQVEQLDDGVPGRAVLLAHLRDAGDSVDHFRLRLEGWYDEQMGRVSGWYKRWAQRKLLIVGLIIAVVLNVDALQVARTLYHDQPVRQVVLAQAVMAEGCPAETAPEHTECIDNQKKVLDDLPLPVGWDRAALRSHCKALTGLPCRSHPKLWFHFLANQLTVKNFSHTFGKIAGWTLTGLAVSLGAPFWFDSLSKLGSLRIAGRRPGENAPYVQPANKSG